MNFLSPCCLRYSTADELGFFALETVHSKAESVSANSRYLLLFTPWTSRSMACVGESFPSEQAAFDQIVALVARSMVFLLCSQ